MAIHILFCKKYCITIIAFEWLFSFMNQFNMPIQMSFVRKCCITSITFEWLLSFMNWFNMPIQGKYSIFLDSSLRSVGFLASPVSYFKEDNFTATDLAACVVRIRQRLRQAAAQHHYGWICQILSRYHEFHWFLDIQIFNLFQTDLNMPKTYDMSRQDLI